MNLAGHRGATLAVGLILLAVVSLLGLAGAASSHTETLLAQNEQFRENAASAASAGIESAICRIASMPEPHTIPLHAVREPVANLAFTSHETLTRFVGFETDLPQEPGTRLVGAHFQIDSVGRSARRTSARQTAGVLLMIPAPAGLVLPPAPSCEAPRACARAGELKRLFWRSGS
jgi:hypothetical protein